MTCFRIDLQEADRAGNLPGDVRGAVYRGFAPPVRFGGSVAHAIQGSSTRIRSTSGRVAFKSPIEGFPTLMDWPRGVLSKRAKMIPSGNPRDPMRPLPRETIPTPARKAKTLPKTINFPVL